MSVEQPYFPEGAMGLSEGASGDDVVAVQEFLGRYGYLPSAGGVEDEVGAAEPAEGAAVPEGPAEQDEAAAAQIRLLRERLTVHPGDFDAATVDGVREYQDWHSLPVTGVVDEATLALMSQPRCGVPDLPFRPVVTRGAVGAGGSAGDIWPSSVVHYEITNTTQDAQDAAVRAGIRAAAATWEAVIPRSIVERPNVGAEITIRFTSNGDRGDGVQFTAQEVAFGFYPGLSAPIEGDITFDDRDTWTVQLPVPAATFDMEGVALHEFGHALGLSHSQDTSAVMWEIVGPGFARRALQNDDVIRIQALYGVPVRVPWVRELSTSAAARQLSAAGLRARYFPRWLPNSWVVSQTPLPGSRVVSGSEVSLRLRTGPIP